MPNPRFLPWATALMIFSAPAFAQEPEQPTDEPTAATEPTDEDVTEPTEDTVTAPTGVVEVVPEPVPEPAPTVEQTPVQQTPPPETATPQTVAAQPTSGRVRIGSKWNRKQAKKEGRNHLWHLDISGYVRAGYRAIENDPNGVFGLYDGFGVANARLTVEGSMKSLGFKLALDGAVDRNDDDNDPNSEVVTRLKDANIHWQPLDALRLTLGQFKPPHDVEETYSTSDLLFIDRSVGSRGVRNVEGPNVSGLSVGREVGIMLGTDHLHFSGEPGERKGFGVSYGLAVTNGHSASHALNDNNKVAFYGRAALHWADLVTLGGGYYHNDRTLGLVPDTIDESVDGWTGDVTFTGWGVTVIGSVMGHTVSRPDIDVDPESTALAYQASIAYKEPFLGFQPAFRFGYLDPDEVSDDRDAVTHMTFALNYRPDYPIAVMLNYTLAQEKDDAALPNNRFDAMLQVTW